jgi:hypothetical protein
VLPCHPWDKQGGRSEGFAQRFGGVSFCLSPPICQVGLIVRWGNSHPQPSERLMPGLSVERALQHEVVHGLWRLVAEKAAWMVWQSPALFKLVVPILGPI